MRQKKTTKHVEAEKKLTDLISKVAQISERGYDVLVGRMYFTGNDGYQNLLVFDPVLSSFGPVVLSAQFSNIR